MNLALTVKLGDFVKIQTGKLDANASSTRGPYPFFTCSRNPLKIDTYSYDCRCVLVAGNGDLNVKYYEGKFDAYQRTYIIESQDEGKLNTRYLYYFLLKYVDKLRALSIGGVIKYIKMNNLTDPQVHLPSLEEQKRIVHELDESGGLSQKRKQAIALLDDYLKAVFLEMFGDPVINPKGWSERFLEEMYINKKEGTKCGPFGSALKKDEYVYNGIPVWTMDNIRGKKFTSKGCLYVTNEKYKELEKYSVKNGDIIISRAGTVGKMAIVEGNFDKSIISTNLIKLSLNPKQLLPLYFVSLMNYCKGRVGRLKTGSDGSFTHMNTGVLDSLKFPVPPIALQEKFACIVKNTELLHKTMIVQSGQLEVNFNVLMQEAFQN